MEKFQDYPEELMSTIVYKGTKYSGRQVTEVSDSLTVEEAIQIKINDHSYTVTMRTPGNLTELVRGLLYTENIYRGMDPLIPVVEKVNDSGTVLIVNVTIPKEELGPGYLNERSILSVSSCGICGKRELDDLSVTGDRIVFEHAIDPSAIEKMFKLMHVHQSTFKESGGSHASAAFNRKGDLLTSMEDIGRHNAVDKVIGSLLEKKLLKEAAFILVSGRISYEIVTKAFMAGIPILASVSAPSSLAVDYAQSLGITLLAFCRTDNATVYSNTERIKHEIKIKN
jgi:FdhD protein